MAVGISDLTAAELSAAAYPNGSVPAGWTLVKTMTSDADGTNSLTIFVNDTTNQVVIAFKGTNNLSEGQSDLANSGGSAWETMQPIFAQALSIAQGLCPGGEIMTDGHSLGGGMAQTAALEYNLSGYGQNSLPISDTAINTDQAILQVGGITNAIGAWTANGNTFSEVNDAGDPATLLYSTLEKQTYLGTTTTTLGNPYVAAEVAGLALSGLPGTNGIGAALAAWGAYESHSIGTVISNLQSQGITSGGSKAADAAAQNASAIISSASAGTPTINSDGSVSIEIGSAPQYNFSIDSVGTDSIIYDISQGGQNTQRVEAIIGGANEIYSSTLAGINAIYDLVGNNQLNLSGTDVTVVASNDNVLLTTGSANITGGNNTITENAGSTVTLNSTDSNTIENAVTGQEFTISGGTIRASGDNGPFGGGATDSFTANNDGSMSLAISDSSGEQTDTDTFSSTGELTQDQQFSDGNLADEINYTSGVETSQVFYSALTGAETAEDIFNSDGSQSDSTFRGGIENISVYNADDQLIEQALIIPNATTTEDFYDPSSGVMTGEVMVNSDGSERDITINQDGSYSRAIFDASGQQTEHDQCNADGSATEDFYDPSSGVQTGENQINSDGSQTNYQFNSDGSQSASVYNAYGQQTEQAQFNADGSATKDFYNAAGQETEALDDFTNGTSQETFFTGLPSGETSETDAFTGADGTGTQTAALFDLTNGTSQELFYTGLSNGEASEDEFFSGTNATGTQSEDLYDFTNGTSQAQYFTGLGSGVSELIDDYMSANGTGTETSQVTDFTAGNSQVTTFTGLPSGESSETDAFSGANGAGTQTAALFNLTNGTSQDFFYNSSTGAETGETDINADGSQDQYTFNANGSQNMTAFNAAGQETEQAQFNADGSATENFYDPSTRAETGETDINADGSQKRARPISTPTAHRINTRLTPTARRT